MNSSDPSSMSQRLGRCISFTLVALVIVGLVGLGTLFANDPKTATVGDPSNPAGLSESIRKAHDAGFRRILIAKGVYHLPDLPGTFCKLDKWEDSELLGEGVTLIAEVPTDHKGQMGCLFELNQCKRVTLSGLVLSQSELTFRQGKVTSIDPGDGKPESWSCVWKADAGYPDLPMPGNPIGSLNIVDAATRLLKVNSGDNRDLSWQPEPGGAFRLSGFKKTPNLAVGDWLVGRRYEVNIPYKIRLRESRECTIRDVTLMRNGFAAIFECGGSGNRIVACRWEPGPKPLGATEEPLLCASADGFHSVGAVKGPAIEECVMQGILLDDCLAINGVFSLITEMAGASVTLKNNRCGVLPNEPIQVAGRTGDLQMAIVTAFKTNPDHTVTLTLDHPIRPPGEGGEVWAPGHCGAGYRIARNKIGNTRSRGMLLKADDGEIRDNVIEEVRMAAVNIGPESAYQESGYWGHITIEGNTLSNCGGYRYGGGAINIHGHGGDTIDNGDIMIQGNKFSANYQGDIEIDSAQNVQVTGNTFTGRTSWPFPMGKPTLARVVNSRDVSFTSNSVTDPSAYASPLILSGTNVSGLLSNWGR